MEKEIVLPRLRYQFSEGSRHPEILNREITKGNCRLAIQLFYKLHGVTLTAEQAQCPLLFRGVGQVISTRNTDELYACLRYGDLIFAERVRNRAGKNIYKPKEQFPDEDAWLISLHTAIFLGNSSKKLVEQLFLQNDLPNTAPLIWHATAVKRGTCLMTADEFEFYYQPIIARRILPGTG